MNQYGKKDFKKWIIVKERIHNLKRPRTFNDGEIWWCAVGENVGSEICGKGRTFARPVAIIRKLDKYSFIGIPLTSKRHIGSWYVNFVFQEQNRIAVVSQVENVSVFRLYSKIGRMPQSDLDLLKSGVIKLLLK